MWLELFYKILSRYIEGFNLDPGTNEHMYTVEYCAILLYVQYNLELSHSQISGLQVELSSELQEYFRIAQVR